MKKPNVTKNYLYNLVYQILIILLPLITTPYISRILGAENIGIYSYTFSIVSYFIILANLGVASYGQREIAYVQDNEKMRSKIFWEITILKCISTMISFIVYYCIYAIHTEYSVYFKLLAIYLISASIDIVWFFQGLEEFKKTVLRNIFVRLVCLISIFIFIKNPQDLWKYICIYSLSELLGNLSLWIYVPKYLKKVKLKELNVIQHIRPTIGLFIPQISLQIYAMIDKTMLGSMLVDKSEVGFYEQTQKIINLLITIVTSLGTVIVPRIANNFMNNNKQSVIQYLNKSFKFTFMLAIPMIFGIILVANEFVPIFFGEGYEEVAILLKILSPIILLTGIANVLGAQYLIPTKKQKQYTIAIIMGTVVNCILNYIMIPYIGAIGACISSIICQIVIIFIQIIYVKKYLDLKKMFKEIINYFIAGIFMLVIVGFGKMNIVNNLYLSILIGGIIYIGMLLFLKDSLVLEGMNKVTYFVNKFINKVKHIE